MLALGLSWPPELRNSGSHMTLPPHRYTTTYGRNNHTKRNEIRCALAAFLGRAFGYVTVHTVYGVVVVVVVAAATYVVTTYVVRR